MLYMYQVYHIFLEIVVKNFQSSSIETVRSAWNFYIWWSGGTFWIKDLKCQDHEIDVLWFWFLKVSVTEANAQDAAWHLCGLNGVKSLPGNITCHLSMLIYIFISLIYGEKIEWYKKVILKHCSKIIYKGINCCPTSCHFDTRHWLFCWIILNRAVISFPHSI